MLTVVGAGPLLLHHHHHRLLQQKESQRSTHTPVSVNKLSMYVCAFSVCPAPSWHVGWGAHAHLRIFIKNITTELCFCDILYVFLVLDELEDVQDGWYRF